jgi:hypothetical protein
MVYPFLNLSPKQWVATCKKAINMVPPLLFTASERRYPVKKTAGRQDALLLRQI